MDKIIKDILEELETLKHEYIEVSANTTEDENVKYGKYWAVRESIDVIKKHINN